MTIFATLAEIESTYDITLHDTKLVDGLKNSYENRYYIFGNRLAVELSTSWMIVYDTLINREMLRKHCWHTSATGLASTRHDDSTKTWNQMLIEYHNNKKTTKFTIQFYT